MPILLAPLDSEVTIVKIVCDEKTKKHLLDLGININTKVKIMSISGGAVVVKINESKIALDRNLATKIFVA